MEIYLNGDKLDLIVEHEKNLDELISGVESWLKGNNFIIQSIKMDDKDIYQETNDYFKSVSIKQINQLSITALPASEIRLSSMQTIIDFLSLLKNGILSNNITLLNELESGYPYMIRSMYHIADSIPISETKRVFADFLNDYAVSPIPDFKIMTDEKKEALVNSISSILFIIDDLIINELEPSVAVDIVTKSLRESITEISEVSIQLQTGKDKPAMDAIIKFSDQLNKLMRIFIKYNQTNGMLLEKKTLDGKNIEEFYIEFNKILSELIEAFQVKDYVLIGDLLEYEIAARLENILDFASEIEFSTEKERN